MKKVLPILILSVSILSCTNSSSDNRKAEIDKNITKNIANKLEKDSGNGSLLGNFTQNGSVESNYKQAISLINSGNRTQGINILQELVNSFPDYADAKTTLDRLESPFSLSASVVEKYIENWINSPSEVPEFSLEKPSIPELPEHPVFQKDEFETSSEFALRVEIAEKEYQEQIKDIKKSYENSVDAYNEAVDLYNTQIDWERKTRAEKVPAMRKRYLDIAFSEVLGNPVVENLDYDADNEVFYGKIVSEYSNLVLNVKIPVILSKAKAFKENLHNIKPEIKIDMVDGNIVFSKVSTISNGVSYDAKLMESEKTLEVTPEVTIGEKGVAIDNFNIKSIKPLKVKQIAKDNRQFFIPKI
jgi:hypothetical protein